MLRVQPERDQLSAREALLARVAAGEQVPPDAAQMIARWFYALRAQNAELEAAVADILSTAADKVW